MKLGMPEGAEETQKAFVVAAVVLIIAITPTGFDAYDAWEKHPNVRPLLVGWYLFAMYVAIMAWRVL